MPAAVAAVAPIEVVADFTVVVTEAALSQGGATGVAR
jgi:hypothetical protein